MRRLLAFVVMAAAFCGAQATTIPRYLAQVEVAADGPSQVRLQLQVEGAGAGTLLVPLAPALKPAGPLRVDGAPVGTQVRTVSVGEKPHLELVLPDGVGPAISIGVAFPVNDVMVAPKGRSRGKRSLPEGSLLLDHGFVNTQPITIGSYRVDLTLPEGTRVHEVREATPKPKRSETEPRVSLNGVDGRQGAKLQFGDVRQGDRTSMSLEVVADHRPLGWLVVGLALAIGYLIGFRDLVSRPQSPEAEAR